MPYLKASEVRTTINIDDDLLAKATKLAGPWTVRRWCVKG